MYEEGTVLAGKYRIERQLGEGGMGIVLAAHHLHLDIKVALKVLHADITDPDRIERFLREARASAQLRSENICRVMDVGRLDDGMPFIVMEMLSGSDLHTLLATDGPLPLSTACDCIMQALLALAEAHGAGIVHRDLKPGNLFWTQRPDGSRLIKVLDFGVAKASNAAFSLTHTTHMVGSPGYMSPEQLRSSKDVDQRTDIWALGVVLYQLLTGELPFVADSLSVLAQKIDTQPMPPLSKFGAIEYVIGRCLEKSVADRYRDVSELAAALAPYLGTKGHDAATAVQKILHGGGSGIAYTAAFPAPIPDTAQPTTLRSSTGVIGDRTPARSWRLSAIVALATLVIAGGVVAITSQLGHDEPASSAAPASQPTEEPAAAGAPTPMPVVAPAAPVEEPKVAAPAAVEDVKPVEPTPVEAAPVEAAPVEAAETKPAPETKPEVETKIATKNVKTATKKATTQKTAKAGTTKTTATKTGTAKTGKTPEVPKTTIEEVSESRQ